ncbi:PfkB family carbohydrate kinase [Pseudoalteromonas xiamenensis]|uniref:Adenylyltransferase/cytidyltransferase family protein n=1 Tax=Pseudoalteromonas xiamenensis TaxID=882626 RepID=A0A975HKL2_9GAMM|nr:PfkB family carbohydrate kinase [Pseudoalteromonas xiamenensis]QTH71037.1 adenylyltransferase/cytidyltransferase family protein [Pseudoalteromonas xiamenensis]
MVDKTVLVQGNFDILHPGHIRLLNFAKSCGNKLIVAVNKDSAMSVKSRVNEQHRLEMVESLECVSEAFLTDLTPFEVVEKLRPYAVVKGKEFESRHNPEVAALKVYGGQLFFGSGEFETNAEQFIKKTREVAKSFDYTEANRYAIRHQIKLSDFDAIFSSISQLNIMVIGEIIVDEYVHGTAVGLSQEDPTIVITPNKTDTYLGGAAITAGHVKALGAKSVKLISVVGNDHHANYVNEKIQDYRLTPLLFVDPSRPTPLKTRFRAGSKTLLRVNQVRQHKISKELQEQIFESIRNNLENTDLLVFSDFNYGLLPQSLVEKIVTLCDNNGIRMVADSQTSSQVGDISRYSNMDLLTPTEREVRVALNNPDDGLVVLAQKLVEKSKPKNLVITLAEEGIFIHKPTENFHHWENDRLPAINRNAVDPAGAGDCFLAASALSLATDSSPWHAFYLGSLAAACQVGIMGNSPLKMDILRRALQESFK